MQKLSLAQLKRLLIVLCTGTALAWTTMGCQSLTPRSVEVPANLMTKCPPLNKLEGMTGADVLRNITSNAELYYQCADSKAALIEAVKTK